MIPRELDFADPIGMLRDCHRRIETFLAVVMRLAEVAKGTALSEQDWKSLQTALCYLREAVPQHMADEEQSLFPRLRRQKDSRVLAVLARIESLEEEHVCSDRIHFEADALGRDWLRRGTLPAADASRLFTMVAQLRDVYRHHIAIEENEVFPAAAAGFPESEIRAVGGEMAFRRGIPRQA